MYMFDNQTGDNVFRDFEMQFKTTLYNDYNHISCIQIHCYTNDKYKHLANVPIIEKLANDTFAYFVDNRCEAGQLKTFAAIVYSPELCKQLNFTIEEKFASIAHEIGHIIHYFNENLVSAGDIMLEIKADEIVVKLGLGESLKSVLRKLKLSKIYSNEQSRLLDLRMQVLG